VAAFEGRRLSFHWCCCGCAFAAFHFGALLFQDCLPREPDAIAFDRKHFH
jgi:hypothetical protein